MVFGDISIFEEMDDEWLEGLIVEPERIAVEIKNPRSAMMVNPLKLKHLNRIDNLNTDIAVINLEDHLKNSTSKIIVRVNPIHEGGKEEIELLNRVKPDVIRVAKIREKSDVEEVLEVLDPDIKLHISIETKESLKNLTELNVDGKVECCSLGIMDMLNSMGLPQSILEINNPTIEYILSRFLVDARIAGIYPIGFTYQDYEDLDGFRKWCEKEKSMGYSAKSCLGPKQVEIANEVFSVYEDELEKARYIKERFEEMSKEHVSGFMDAKYGFIDEPIYKDALLILGQI